MDHLEYLEARRRALLTELAHIEDEIERYTLQAELEHLSPTERRKLWRLVWGGAGQ